MTFSFNCWLPGRGWTFITLSCRGKHVSDPKMPWNHHGEFWGVHNQQHYRRWLGLIWYLGMVWSEG